MNDRLHLAHFKIREESSIPCKRETNCVCSLAALQLLLLPSKVSLLTSLNFDASAPRGLFSFFFFFKHFFIALHLKFTVCIFPLQPYLVLEIKGDRNSLQNKCDCHIWHFPRTVQTLCQRHAGLGMEAANTAINCCGLHLYNVSQSPEDIKQMYKSILSSSGAWLSPKERPSALQRQQRYLWGQAKLQSSAQSLRITFHMFKTIPASEDKTILRNIPENYGHHRSWLLRCTKIPPADLSHPKGHLGSAPQPHLWSRRSSRCCTRSPLPRCSTAS